MSNSYRSLIKRSTQCQDGLLGKADHDASDANSDADSDAGSSDPSADAVVSIQRSWLPGLGRAAAKKFPFINKFLVTGLNLVCLFYLSFLIAGGSPFVCVGGA